MTDQAKNSRRIAKGNFTRKRNILIKSIETSQGIEVVETNYAKLVDAWEELERKHLEYVNLLTDEHLVDEEELWMTEVEEKYSNAFNRKVKYVENVTASEKATREHATRQEAIDNAKVKRNTARAVFEASYQSISHALQSKEMPNFVLRDLQKQIEDQFQDCKTFNAELLKLLPFESAESEMQWIAKIQTYYYEIVEQIVVKYTNVEEQGQVKQESGATYSFLQLEKVKMPHFDGELRHYPQFKRDFNKQVMPQIRARDAAYVLRSCLGKEPESLVKSIDDDVQEMWRRLDEKYGDPAKIADVIIDGIRRFRTLKEGEDKRFIEFVTLVEDGYRDLTRLGLEAEITTTSSVSIIEKALSTDIRRKWAELVSCQGSHIEKSKKFPSLLEFLQNQRSAIEYDSASLRTTNINQHYRGTSHYTEGVEEVNKEPKPKCLIHEHGRHWTADCRIYLAKPIEEKKTIIKDKRACWSCLKIGHRQRTCRSRKDCGVGGCTRKHHPSIHETEETPQQVSASASVCHNTKIDTCLLQVQRVKTKRGEANIMWDNAASLCFITNTKAKQEKLKGLKVELSVIKIGAQSEKIKTNKYKVPLIDKQGHVIEFEAYGIERITSDIESVNIDDIAHLFKNVTKEEIERPSGPVDILIGYEYAAYHPEREQNIGHLVLLRNRFGRCSGGTHPLLKESHLSHDFINARVNTIVGKLNIEDFYKIENLGVECKPKCGGCKCGKCSLGAKDYTIQEERELELIERNLNFDKEENRWIAEYPWIKDPQNLPDNRKVAFAKLITTEKRLRRNPEHAKVYDNQIKDMVTRRVARKLSNTELTLYKGPVHYIGHHEVLKPDSKSTPVRIVFNSSANYMGHILNEYWAKGPDLLNNLLGVLIRFRENKVAFIGDIKKMYHTVKMTELDQHTHRFLWRDMDSTREPDTYIMLRVSFGDKPSATIATVALRKTAEMSREKYPEAADIIQRNTYMDDIIESTDERKQAIKLTQDIEKAIIKGGFEVKEWMFSSDINRKEKTNIPIEEQTEKILGVKWSHSEDQLCFEVKFNFTTKRKHTSKSRSDIVPTQNPQQLTKRIILSQINSVYDPLGLAGPFTVRAKILLRRFWGTEPKLDWDDPIPEENQQSWSIFFNDLIDMNQIRFTRCLKPMDAIGDPILIVFSDASADAYAACAYVRWQRKNNQFESNLILSKNRLAPIKKMSIDRIELCGAVLKKRLKVFIEKECRYRFEKIYHIVDSQIVHAMIQKSSYGFNTFAATRIGEIQEGTNPENWYWVESKYNIADCLTRGRKPDDIGLESTWQKGPDFLKQAEDKWPITRDYLEPKLSERIRTTMVTKIEGGQDTLASRIDIAKYSSYGKLLRVTARILKFYSKFPKPSFKSATQELTPEDIKNAEIFWIKEIQQNMRNDIEDGKYNRLCPTTRKDGIYVVSSRIAKLQTNYSDNEVILLPYDHPFSRLYVAQTHARGHHGILTTASKVRTKYWIPKLLKLVKSIKFSCIICKKLAKKTSQQVMGQLPEDRLKPAPPWYSTGIDLFGPFKIRDEIKKRTFSKAYGVIFNCLGTRAVYLDLAADYSTEKFLMVFRRFVSINGYPSKLLSDNGTQLIAASKELTAITKTWDWKKIKEYGVMDGLQWIFTPADAPWQNGVTEALIRSVKRAVEFSIGENTLTFSELQTVLFEIANLLNERPIGRHPTSPEDGAYLCPNDLLLGRATSRIPNGPFDENANARKRFTFVQTIVNTFWKRWNSNYFPSLMLRQKWHTSHRNLKIGDVVLIQDSNLVRGNWKLGKVSNVYPGADGKVRRVDVQYKNLTVSEPTKQYQGKGYVTVQRPVQRLVLLIPIDEN